MTSVQFQVPSVTSGASSLLAVGGDGSLANSPRMSFYTRADLAAAVLPSATPGVYVERYAAGGPVAGMYYSLENTSQTSVDPTSMAVSVKDDAGAASTKYTRLRNAKVTPAMMGAPYDGSTDDAPYIQKCLTYFGNSYADYGAADLTIKSPIKCPANTVLDHKDGPKWLVDLTTAFNNTNLSGTYIYGDNAAIIQADGSLSGTDVPKVGVTIRGVHLKPITFVEQRANIGISVRNCKNVRISECEIEGFCIGYAICLNSCQGGDNRIDRNYIHDFYSAYAWNSAGLSQQTGILVDPDRVMSGKNSQKVFITDNRVLRLTKDPTAAVGSGGQQADGINIQSTPADTFHVITGNILDTVDEGIDCFASKNLIQGNQVINPTGAGVKLIHGACHNIVADNVITGATLWGFCVAATVNGDCSFNIFRNNKVIMAGGSTYATPAAIFQGDYDSGGPVHTYHYANGNVFMGNYFDATACPTNVHDGTAQTGSKNRSVGDYWVGAGTDASGWLDNFVNRDSFLFERPVNGTRVRAILGSNQAEDGTGNEQTLAFNTILVDDRGEFNTTTHKAVLSMIGWYSGRVSVSSDTFPNANLLLVKVYADSPASGVVKIMERRLMFNAANSRFSAEFNFKHFMYRSTSVYATIDFAGASSGCTLIGGGEDNATAFEIWKD